MHLLPGITCVGKELDNIQQPLIDIHSLTGFQEILYSDTFYFGAYLLHQGDRISLTHSFHARYTCYITAKDSFKGILFATEVFYETSGHFFPDAGDVIQGTYVFFVFHALTYLYIKEIPQFTGRYSPFHLIPVFHRHSTNRRSGLGLELLSLLLISSAVYHLGIIVDVP
ncbi:MAG: hypothetical protein A4E23_00710 [Methanomethylovorans sp. PtaU1.Bin073]|nr:MAG: hypothetical protein A4E23_00710 [Methanomethylovorans sp. PtaU1.Bin073]